MKNPGEIFFSVVLSVCVGSTVAASYIWWKHKDDKKEKQNAPSR